MHVRNTATHVVDLDDGRTLAPGESADTDSSDRLTELLDAGLLSSDDEQPAAVDVPAAPAERVAVTEPAPEPAPSPFTPSKDTATPVTEPSASGPNAPVAVTEQEK